MRPIFWRITIGVLVVLLTIITVLSSNITTLQVAISDKRDEIKSYKYERDSLSEVNYELITKLDKANNARQYWYETSCLYRAIIEKGVEKQNINTEK